VVAGFENDASTHQANPLLVEKHAEAAAALTTELLQRGLGSVFPCEDGLALSDCADDFIDRFGLRAYRRPLSSGERASYRALYDRASPGMGHEVALGTIIEVALQAPQFLYRVEAPISTAEGSAVPLGPYEMASRLSYFLWGTTPDETLLQSAASDALRTPAQVEAVARRLIQDEKAIERAREFHSQWLGLSRFNSMIARDDAPDGASPAWNESTLRFIDAIFWGQTPTVVHLFSSPVFYYDSTLAGLYGLESPSQWTSTASPDERHGLLTLRFGWTLA
jgi:hypothetical protein